MLAKKIELKILFLVVVALVYVGGCKTVPQFPQRAMHRQLESNGYLQLAFDTNNDGKPDYWQEENANGRKVILYFKSKNCNQNGGKNKSSASNNNTGNSSRANNISCQTVNLDDIKPMSVPHFIIALDGVPYQLVKNLYDQGWFRLFYPPTRMVSTFPAMTDLAFHRIFGGGEPVAYQAKHFDVKQNRMISGDEYYLSGQAADWSHKLAYRCSFKLDPIAYVMPQVIFDHELKGFMEAFRKAKSNETVIVYSVATAGLGTRGGRLAILKYLRTIDQLCEQIVYQRHGRVKITLLADHGHNMSGRGRVSFRHVLEKAGYHLTDKLVKPKDVVTVEYGLVTYAAYFTKDPAGVARALLTDPATTIACYPQGNAVVVQTIRGLARVRYRPSDNRYSYETQYGDPLQLKTIIKRLRQQGKVDSDGFIDDRAMLDATATHIYPDPLHRVWEAFHGLVKEPADLIVCLKDGWVHGSEFFNVMIGGAASTHGSLNQINSMTYVLTMLGKLPPIIRVDDFMGDITKLRTANK